MQKASDNAEGSKRQHAKKQHLTSWAGAGERRTAKKRSRLTTFSF